MSDGCVVSVICDFIYFTMSLCCVRVSCGDGDAVCGGGCM